MATKAKQGEFLTKESAIEKMAEKSGISKTDAKKAMDALIGVVTETVADGGEVNITGFGKFHQVSRAARNGVNPKTKEKIKIEARTAPAFKAGSTFKDAVR